MARKGEKMETTISLKDVDNATRVEICRTNDSSYVCVKLIRKEDFAQKDILSAKVDIEELKQALRKITAR